MDIIKDFPKRHILTLMCFFGMFSAYTLRFNFPVAIVAMVKEPKTAGVAVVDIEETCTELLDYNNFSISDFSNASSNFQGEFEWDSNVRGQILASFFYGYTITQIPGAILAEKYGAKRVYGIGMLVTALLSVLTPIVARWSFWALIVSRVVQGLAQGVVMPANNALVGRWAAKMERSRVSTFIFIGSSMGNAIVLAGSGALCESQFLGGWPSVFYVSGFIGCVWFILWTFFIHESPETHPRITKEELQFILSNQDRNQKKLPVPWKNLMTSIPVWALGIAHMGRTWGYFTLLIELPNYLANILHFNIKNNGMLSALPQIVSVFVSFLSSFVADKMREKGCLRVTTIRKIFNSIGFFGAAVCLLLVVFVGCEPTTIVVLLVLSSAVSGASFSGFAVTHVDMSPELAGTLFGLTNFFASMTGFLSSSYVGWIMQNGQTAQRWNVIFITSAAIFIIGGVIYDLFSSAEPQNFRKTSDNLKEDKSSDIKNISGAVELRFANKVDAN